MKYVILSNGHVEVKKLLEMLGIKDTGYHGGVMYTHNFTEDGNFNGWDFDGTCGVNICQLIGKHSPARLVLASDVISGKVKLPWMLVDESRPPKGYRLVTKAEMQTTLKPRTAMFWEDNRSQNVWETTNYASKDWSRDTYCIPKDTVLEPIKPKPVKMTVAEISKALGKTIEIVEG